MAVNLGQAIAYLDLDTSKFESGLSSAWSSLNTFADTSLSATSRFNALGSALESTGSTLTKTVTLPIVGIGTAVTKVAGEFEEAMSKVEAISGATAEEMVDLKDKAIEMGAKTKFSAKESADAFTYMAMAGWDAGQMIDGIGGIMSLAAADGLDLATTSDIVTDALTAFGLQAKDSSHFADVLAQASSSANTNVAMLGESFKYVGPVAGTFKYSVEDVSLGLGLMANSGIKASQAGTSFRAALTNLAKPTDSMVDKMVELGLATQETARVYDQGKIEKAQIGAAQKTLALEQAQVKYNDAVAKYGAESTQAQSAALRMQKAQLGVADANGKLTSAQQGSIEVIGIQSELLADSSGNMKSLRDVMITLREAFSGLSAEEQANAAATLFGKEAMSGMLAIINASDEDFNNLANAIDNSDGRADAMAETMMDNLPGAIEQLSGAIESLAIKLGDALIPTIRSVAEWLTALVDHLNEMDEAQVQQIVSIGAVVAAIGPVLLILGKVIKLGSSVMSFFSSLPAIGASLASIGSALAPILLIVAAVAGLVAVFKELYDTNEEFRSKVQEIWENISNDIGAAIETVQGVFETFKEALGVIPEILSETFNLNEEGIGEGFVNVFESIQSLVEQLLPILESVASVLGGVLLTAISAVVGIVNGLLNALGPILNIVSDLFNIIGDFGGLLVSLFTGDFASAGDYLADIWDNVKDIVANAIEGIIGFVSGFVSGFWETLTSLFGSFGVDIEGALSTVWEAISGFFEGLWEDISGFGEDIAEFFTVTIPEAFNKAVEAVGGFVDDVASFFTETIPEAFDTFVTETLPNAINSIVEWFEELPYKIGYAIGQFAGFFYNAGVEIGNWVTEELPVIIDNIVEWFSELPDKIGEWLDNTIKNIGEWGKNIIDEAVKAGSEFVDNIVSFFTELPDKITEKVTQVYNDIKSWKSDMTEQAKQTGSDFLEELKEWFTSLPKKIEDWLKSVVAKIKEFKEDMKDAAKKLLEAFWDGLKETWKNIVGWFEKVGEKISEFFGGISDGFDDAKKSADSLSKSTSGSHANGLSYVPFNGYVAELHQGERVLTKQENREYNESRLSGGNTFNFYGTEKLDQRRTVREFETFLRQFEILGG